MNYLFINILEKGKWITLLKTKIPTKYEFFKYENYTKLESE